MECLRELGPGWLKQIICIDTDDLTSLDYRAATDDPGYPITLGTPNAAGEQVDLLNAMDDGPPVSIHAEEGEDEDEDEVNMIDSIGALSKPSTRQRNGRPYFQPDCKRGLSEPGESDDGLLVAAQTRQDDLAVQEQALNFVRNLICGPDAADMIDHLFEELGQDQFFDVLSNLLRARVLDAFNRDRRSSGAGVRHVPPPTEIVIAVCFIIVHLAGGLPRHRQLLISQSELLKLLIPLFSHPHSEIRVCCVWTVINLTWTDDQSDKLHCRARATELRKLGVLGKLEELESDIELDVRERTKTAMIQMVELLRT